MHRLIIAVGLVMATPDFMSAHICANEPLTDSTPTIASFTKGMQKMPGYFDLYWDEDKGRLWLAIDRWQQEFLYQTSLPRGVGSNDIGLDRGQLSDTHVVSFLRIGPKVLLVEHNTRYRAVTDNPDERQAVEESFARSVLSGFKVKAVEGEAVLVDATDFALRDGHGVSDALRRSGEGDYSVDAARSAIYLGRTKSFPNNTEIEAILTFKGRPKGRYLQTVTPTADSVTVHQRHSFVKLPAAGYTPRRFHPGCGFFSIQFRDYAASLDEPIDQKLITRHRLTKDTPLMYYLDRGAPEPIREALLSGARWWAKAFTEAGFKDGFRVELLPEGADPMDVRYNIIQWVHRSTRGWSYGASVVDPRTGEIIKGHVSLGSLRVRQDMLIAQGLTAPFDGRDEAPEAKAMALARLRQLSAHEVGHTLGLAHNFAASTTGNASVMDYPHPYLGLKNDGSIDLSKAYEVGVGAWDKVAIQYGYSQVPEGAVAREYLPEILFEAHKRGLVFISDQDARPAGGAHPAAHLWDNGKDPIAELQRIMQVRQRALDTFDARAIAPGIPLTLLEERLVPVYLLHRYQTEAAVKVLGGVEYVYAVRGEVNSPVMPVPADVQTRALNALLKTIDPGTLALPERILRLIPPRALGYPNNREVFSGKTGPTLDPVAMAESSADHSVGLILHPQRCARLVEQAARNPDQPGLGKVIDRLIERTWRKPSDDRFHDAIGRAVDKVILSHLMQLAANDGAHTQVRAIASLKLARLKMRLRRLPKTDDEALLAHVRWAVRLIDRFEEDPKSVTVPGPVSMPPGSPIGACGIGCACRGW